MLVVENGEGEELRAAFGRAKGERGGLGGEVVDEGVGAGEGRGREGREGGGGDGVGE